jgi:thiol:disulfide interchange protein
MKILIVMLLVIIVLCCYNREKFSLAPYVNKRVVIYHYQNWCGACKVMGPNYFAAKSALENRGITFIENDEGVKPTAGVNAYPTITVIDERGKRHQHVGVLRADDLITFITTPYYTQ